MHTTGSADVEKEEEASTSQPPQQSPPSVDDNADEKDDHHHFSDKLPEPSKSAGAASKVVDYANWEFEPPLANIRRLLKHTLPKGTNISKDSVTCLSRASGIFVLYLTNCAIDVAREGKRSTIAAKDVMAALKELDLGEFIPELEQFLSDHHKYERNKKDEKDRIRKLHADGTGSGFGNKKGVRGADGKYVGAVISKEDGRDDLTDDEDRKADASTPKHAMDHRDNAGAAMKKAKLEHDEESDA